MVENPPKMSHLSNNNQFDQWLKIPMEGLSDSMFLVSIQWIKISMD